LIGSSVKPAFNWCSSRNENFFSSLTKAKILTAEILNVFKQLKFEADQEIKYPKNLMVNDWTNCRSGFYSRQMSSANHEIWVPDKKPGLF